MIKSKTDSVLQELNEEIQMIIKSDSENDTSYFPDAEKILESFENYLKCYGIENKTLNFNKNANHMFLVFQENISSVVLLRYQRFITLMHEWNFLFKNSIYYMLYNPQNEVIENKKFLPNVNMTEIILLMYLSLEVERKEIIGEIKFSESKNMFFLREVVKILNQFYVKEKIVKQNKLNRSFIFSINQDKFVKILLLKALKIKLERQNFSFGLNLKPQKPNQIEKIQEVNSIIPNDSNKEWEKNRIIDENFSMISVQSEYNQSGINENKEEKMKQSMIKLEEKLNEGEFEFEMKNLSSEEIFQYVSLNDLKGYITK